MAQVADVLDNNDVAEEIAFTSSIAMVRHLHVDRGRELRKLRVVGGQVFDLEVKKA